MNLNRLLPFVLLSIIHLSAFGQTTIVGKILSAQDSTPIPGATVYVKTAKIGAVSNVKGEFTLTIPDSLLSKKISLRVLFIGYSAVELCIDPKQYMADNPLNIFLKDTPVHLNEVVVTGYSAPRNAQDRVPVFPWPPPDYTALTVLDRSYFETCKRLSDANQIMVKALTALGYHDRSYYYIPNGFALVTRIEQIAENGQPLDTPLRWSATVRAYNHLSWPSYLKALIFPAKGYFRIIVFAVTDKGISSSGKKVSKKVAEEWLKEGLSLLPSRIGKKDFNEDYNCTALIYEYKKVEAKDAELLIPGTLTGVDHLTKSKILLLLNSH